jgi:hypothetical protein
MTYEYATVNTVDIDLGRIYSDQVNNLILPSDFKFYPVDEDDEYDIWPLVDYLCEDLGDNFEKYLGLQGISKEVCELICNYNNTICYDIIEDYDDWIQNHITNPNDFKFEE